MAEENIAVQIAQLQEQMKAIADNVENIKLNVNEIMSLDKTIAEMVVHHEQTKSEMTKIWQKIDQSVTWQQAHEDDCSNIKQATRDQVNTVDAKIEAVVNKGRGALWFGGIVFVIVQTILSATVIWAFGHINENDSLNRVQEYRIEQLEKHQEKTNEMKPDVNT